MRIYNKSIIIYRYMSKLMNEISLLTKSKRISKSYMIY